jgi:hypothetical protein
LHYKNLLDRRMVGEAKQLVHAGDF